jgi:hypothetical protein
VSGGKGKRGGRGQSTDRRSRQQQALRAARQRPTEPLAGTPGIGEQPGAGGGAAGAEQRYYLDVSAVRIQEWLARTPSLKQWRGASAMLSEATAQDTWKGMLPAGTEWNDEAGDLAGVVSLRAVGGPPEEVREVLAAAAREVAVELRRALPYCPIRGYIGAGPSYAVAYKEIDRARRADSAVVDAAPAPAEVILAMSCQTCLQAGAVEQIRDDDGQDRRVCGECARRRSAAGRTTGQGAAVPKAEAVLRDALVELGHPQPRFPDNSQELAAAGDTSGARTQVALVYADGNRVGAFLARAADLAARHGRPHKDEIVTAIGRATVAALAVTVRDLFGTRDVLPVIAHVADGDDVMVSVPAPDAWPFVRRLLVEFTTQLAAYTASWPPETGRALPSLSAGVVFHHHSHPFSDAVQLAKRRLRSAKERVEGRVSTVDFLDLTADGDQAPARRAMTLPDIDSKAQVLDRVAVLPRAQRATLLGLCREAAEQDQPGVDHRDKILPNGGPAETAAQALARRLVELNAVPLWQAIGLSVPADVTQAQEQMAGPDRVTERAELRAVLDLARWWPPPKGKADPSTGAAAAAGGRAAER